MWVVDEGKGRKIRMMEWKRGVGKSGWRNGRKIEEMKENRERLEKPMRHVVFLDYYYY